MGAGRAVRPVVALSVGSVDPGPAAGDPADVAELHGDDANVDEDEVAVGHGGEVEEGLPGHDSCVSVY